MNSLIQRLIQGYSTGYTPPRMHRQTHVEVQPARVAGVWLTLRSLIQNCSTCVESVDMQATRLHRLNETWPIRTRAKRARRHREQ